MERKIKFRGKTIDGKWIEGDLIQFDGRAFIAPSAKEGVLDKLSNAKKINFQQVIGGCFKEVIPETVGQFTGLTDKNGNEIYEGDELNKQGLPLFVKFSHNQKVLLLKEFNSKTNWRSLEWLSKVSKYVEITGNIHNK